MAWGIIAGGGVIFLLMAIGIYLDDAYFEQNARPVEARLISKKPGHTPKAPHILRYEYTVSEKTYKTFFEAKKHYAESVEVGSMREAWYLPSRPEKVLFTFKKTETPVIIIMAAGGVLLLFLGGIPLRKLIKRKREKEWLLQHGILTEATIMQIKEKWYRTDTLNFSTRTYGTLCYKRVIYAYRDEYGEQYVGKSDEIPANELPSSLEGKKLKVRYRKDRPEISAICEQAV